MMSLADEEAMLGLFNYNINQLSEIDEGKFLLSEITLNGRIRPLNSAFLENEMYIGTIPGYIGTTLYTFHGWY